MSINIGEGSWRAVWISWLYNVAPGREKTHGFEVMVALHSEKLRSDRVGDDGHVQDKVCQTGELAQMQGMHITKACEQRDLHR